MRDRINAPIAIVPPSRARPRARALATPSIRRKHFPSIASPPRAPHRALARVVASSELPRRDPASRARVVESSHLDRRRRGLGLGFALGAHDHGRALRAALRRARGGAREGDGVQGSREHRGVRAGMRRRRRSRDRSIAARARATVASSFVARGRTSTRGSTARDAIDRSRDRRRAATTRALSRAQYERRTRTEHGLKSSSRA